MGRLQEELVALLDTASLRCVCVCVSDGEETKREKEERGVTAQVCVCVCLESREEERKDKEEKRRVSDEVNYRVRILLLDLVFLLTSVSPWGEVCGSNTGVQDHRLANEG